MAVASATEDVGGSDKYVAACRSCHAAFQHSQGPTPAGSLEQLLERTTALRAELLAADQAVQKLLEPPQ
jgi:hypothetical protein